MQIPHQKHHQRHICPTGLNLDYEVSLKYQIVIANTCKLQ